MKTQPFMPNIMETREVLLTRVYSFSATHRLHSPFLSDEENRKVYGKCGRPAGHGHNYVLKVTVKGPLDPLTGKVIDVASIDEIVNREVIEPLDHKSLNIELSSTPILTSEILIEEIWKRLRPHIKEAKLHQIDLGETRKNSFEYSE